MKLLDHLLDQDRLWERKEFPTNLCIHQNNREASVMDAKERFLCLLEDERNTPEQLDLRILTPYTAWDEYGDFGEKLKESDRKLLFGWTDGPNVYDHFENNVHGDSQVVVVWSLLREDE